MDSIVRGICVYLFVMLVFRMGGKRTMAQTTTFDLVLLLIISETTQEAMLDGDHSITNAFLLIVTLVGLDILFSEVKLHLPLLKGFLEPTPLIIVENGKLHRDRMRRARVDEADILNNARLLQGLERLDQIKYAILEPSGEISVVPRGQA